MIDELSQKVNQTDLMASRNRESLERNRLLTIVNNLTDSLLVVSKAGKIEVFNASALNLLDTNESLIGKNLDSLLNLKDESLKLFNFKQNLKSVTTSIIRNDLTLSIEDEVIKIELSILPIKNIYSENSKNNQKSFVVILRDITKEKTLDYKNIYVNKLPNNKIEILISKKFHIYK